nr:Wzz/FepE/Etk N-terminal domain-containing protein [Flavobacteriales bacterium]
MSVNKTSQRGSIIDAKDLRFFLRIAAKNWYFVVIALVLSSVLSYLYTYKLPNIFGASTQILLKDRDSYDYQSQVYKSLGYVGVYGDIVNQKRVLTSYDLIDEALSKLDFDVSYYIVGRFKTSQVHGTLPFTVHIEPLKPELFERLIDLKILDTERFELTFEYEGLPQKRVHRFNEEVRDPLYILTVHSTPWMTKESMANVAGTDYQFKRHQRSKLVEQYKKRIEVENQEFTTILSVTVEDEVESRAKTFLDTLSKVY